MSNKAYDIIKIIALIIAPVIVFISTIIDIWNVPYGPQITATLAALDILIGTIVTILKKVYDKKHVLTDVDLDLIEGVDEE